jgi:regulator of extracellular matrix RemA (YlzA/DUF370 family)
MDWLKLDDAGLIALERVVAVGPAESAGMERLLRATPDDRLIILTGGRKRRSVLVLDSGHVVVTALTLEQIGSYEPRMKRIAAGGPPPATS